MTGPTRMLAIQNDEPADVVTHDDSVNQNDSTSSDDDHADAISKTRKELEELDDLDV